jgi:hypothetical protein
MKHLIILLLLIPALGVAQLNRNVLSGRAPVTATTTWDSVSLSSIGIVPKFNIAFYNDGTVATDTLIIAMVVKGASAGQGDQFPLYMGKDVTFYDVLGKKVYFKAGSGTIKLRWKAW